MQLSSHKRTHQSLYTGQKDALRFSQSGLSGLKCSEFRDEMFAFDQETYSVARNCSKRALMRPRPRRTLRRFREWLPCFFTQSFWMSLSRMSLSVRYDLPAPMRSFTWKDEWVI